MCAKIQRNIHNAKPSDAKKSLAAEKREDYGSGTHSSAGFTLL